MSNTNPQQQQNLQQQQQLNSSINDYRETLSSISEELGRQKRQITAATGEYSKLDSIARQLQSTEKGISGLTSDQIKKLQQKYEYSIKELSNQATQLEGKKNLGRLDEQKIKDALTSGLLDEKEAALLSAKLDGFRAEKSLRDTLNDQLQERVDYESKIKDLTGATGALLDGMKGSMDALGLSSMSNYLNIDAAKQAMQEEADAIARGEKQGGAFQVRMAGIKTLAEGLNKALFSAEAIIGFIVNSLAAGSQNMADFQKQTGMGYWNAYAMNNEMQNLAIETGDAFITSEKLNKSYSMLTSQLGVSADILGGDALISATNLEQRLGMSAEAASSLTQYTRLQGENTEEILANAYDTVGAFNKQNKTAINVNQVMSDVAGASKATYLNMGKNVEAMAATATKARSLGLSLATVEKISGNLLNFEDSIGKEMEANLLLGGGVNLAKAREYALTGDTAKLTEEIGKQEGIRNAFATNNVIAQKAAADALGISTEELAEMNMKQELLRLGAEGYKDAYGETSYEAAKSRSATEALGDAMEKVKSVLGGIIQIFTPLLDGLAYVLNIPFMPQVLAAIIAAKVLASNFSKVKDSISGAFKAMSGLKDKIMGGASSVKDKVMGPAADKAKSLAGDAGGADEKKGGGVKGFLTGLADGLKAFGKDAGKVLMGAAVLGGVFIILGASMKGAMMIIGDTDPTKMLAFTASITMLGLTLAVMGKIGGNIMQGAVAIAVLGGAMIAAAYAFSLLKGVDTNSLIAFSIAVPLLALAAAGLGFLAGPIALGAVALGLLGLALIPLAIAFKELGSANIEGILTPLTQLAQVAGPLLGVGAALFGIAAGLAAIGVAGITSIPGIMALTALSVIAPALTGLANAMGPGKESKSVGEAKSKSDEGSLAALEAKITELIAVVREGGDVYMDTVKVGKALQLGRTKL
jgi:hypothetical protein